MQEPARTKTIVKLTIFMCNYCLDVPVNFLVPLHVLSRECLANDRTFYSCLFSDLAGGDLVLIKTSLSLLCRSSYSYAN